MAFGNNYIKLFLSVILILLCLNSFAQQTGRALSFKAVTYNEDGSVWNTRIELIKDTAATYDLYFISKNFYTIPLPSSFESNEYKNHIVETSTGRNPKTKRVQTLVYDEYSRLISFSQSGCEVCTDPGYEFDIHYNINNQVDTMTGAEDSPSTNKKYEIRYNPNGDVKLVDYFTNGKLALQISLF